MPGPPKKPTKLKLLAGNPGKRALPTDEPQPHPEIPDCPKALQGEALGEWQRITLELHKLGLIGRVDMAMLADYCETWGEWCKAFDDINENGMFLKAPSGLKRRNPALTARLNLSERLATLASHFGLSPAARARISAPNKAKQEDAEIKEFFG